MSEKLSAQLHQTIRTGELVATALPLCPEVKLWLLSEDYPRGRLPHDEMIAILNAPAYWAFCWASGQVLARYIIDKNELFKDKCIVDFGAGSGVVGIAAKLAGATRVIACDLDEDALLASAENAILNGVDVELCRDINKLDVRPDLIIAADVLYDRENFCWLETLPTLADDVLIADSRVKSDRLVGYKIIDKVEATTIPDLDEHKEFNEVRIYRVDQ